MPDPVTSGGQESQRGVLTVLWGRVRSAILDNRDTHFLYYKHDFMHGLRWKKNMDDVTESNVRTSPRFARI